MTGEVPAPQVQVRRAALFAAALPALLLAAGCAAVQAPGVAARAGDPVSLAESLPAVAAGFRRGEIRPAAAPGGGREVAYSTGGGRSTSAAATVELIADGAEAPAALDAALAEIARGGPARQMRDAGRFTTPGGGAVPPLACAETAGRYGRERVAGLVCTGRVSGALLRIRVTMPARQPPPADPRAFAETIAASLSGPPGTVARPG